MDDINWRRFLAFTPVAVVLAFLTAYRREIAPQLGDLFFPIEAILFIVLIILFYGMPRWKPTHPPMTKRGFILLAVVLIGFIWFAQTNWFVQLPTGVLLGFSLVVGVSALLWTLLRRR